MTGNNEDKLEQELEKWLSPDYKLTGKDKEKAEKLLEDYFAEGTKARKLRDIGNPSYGMIIRNSMSDEELKEYQKMIALSNKIGLLSGFAEGIFGGIPFWDTLGDKLSEYIMESEGHTLLDISKGDTMYDNSLKKHGIATVAGTLTANIALWEIGTKAVKWVPKGAKGSKTVLAQYGEDFGNLGKYVENPNIKVDWSQYAEHGAERMQQRGMTQEIVNNIVDDGKVLSQNGGNKFAYITQMGVAIVSKDGKLITAWSSADFDSNMLEVITKLFGKQVK